MRWKPMEITGWGRTRRARVLACRPESTADVLAALADTDGDTVLVHGAGRSYGDVALNDGGRVLLTERLNRLISFDEETLELVCEPGVTYRDLLTVFAPRGYLYPVSPGTAYTTIGGAVASDLHGKNHEFAGSFGDHVRWIELALPSGEVKRVSRTEDPDLFAATIGGLGLTGVISRIGFTMTRTPSEDMWVHERRIPDLDAFIEAFEECRRRATYTVAWLDGLARNRELGRGILETAELAEPPSSPQRARRSFPVPFDMPAKAVLNPTTVGVFNALYYRRVPAEGRVRRLPVARYLYPLDAILHWNRVYGRQGFHQFQCVIPDDEAPRGLRKVIETVTESHQAPFLGVLKTFGGEGSGYLSFPMRGYTLALDFPHREGVLTLLRRLEDITLEHCGRVYLAKDAALSASGFRAMYPRHKDYRAVLQRVDPDTRFSSDLARRLELRR